MLLRDQFNEDLKGAMKERDVLRLSVLRMVKAAVKNKEIEQGRELPDDEVVKVLGTLVKQRRDAAEQYDKGGRPELASKEMQEITCIEKYLPQAPPEAEIDAAIEDSIRESHATSARDIGAVMKAVMKRLEGRPVDGRTINAKVRQRLGNVE